MKRGDDAQKESEKRDYQPRKVYFSADGKDHNSHPGRSDMSGRFKKDRGIRSHRTKGTTIYLTDPA